MARPTPARHQREKEGYDVNRTELGRYAGPAPVPALLRACRAAQQRGQEGIPAGGPVLRRTRRGLDVTLPYADSLADEVLATGTHSRKASSTTMMSVESMPRANS